MKKIAYTILAVFLMFGCSKQPSIIGKQLDEVENAIEVNPDSANALLDNIHAPETLNNSSFARWCMLSGKLTDIIYDSLLPAEYFERAYAWYLKHGTSTEQVQILIYLGRSYTEDGDYDKAMAIFTDAIDIADKNELNNSLGYIYSYMGDLYQLRTMIEKATKKYKTAAKYFMKAGNTKSYACALRDVGYGYTCMDSLNIALSILFKADSVATNLDNKNVKASIDNIIGNTYLIKADFEKAKKHFLEALKLGRNKLPNYVALIEMYIKSDSVYKAKELLKKLPQDDPEYTYSIKKLSYLIHKADKDYQSALANLEECTNIVDSVLQTENKSKIVNIEARYNNLKIKEQVKSLRIKQKNYIIIVIVCVSIILLGILGYLLYRKSVEERIRRHKMELSNLKIDFLNLSIELEKKKKLLSSIAKESERYRLMKEEIMDLSCRYKKLQNKLLSDSPVYKELLRLVNQNIPRIKKPLITESLWKLIYNDITAIYPNLYDYISNLCPDLTEQEIDYCCFCMYGFDTNAEARLLSISPGSVRTKRLRLRQRLNITLPNQTTLYEYLVDELNYFSSSMYH